MKYDALIFDMDGTLIHNMPIHNLVWQDTLSEAGVQIELEEFNRTTTGKKNSEILRMLLGDHLNETEISHWAERKEALYRERFADKREPLPGLLHILDQAKELQIPMAVATAAPPANISFILDGLNLRRYFKVVVGGDDVQQGKPDPEIFLKAAKALEVEPTRSLVFEDALSGVEAARRADMDAVLICTTIDAEEVAGMNHVIAALPDFTYFDFATQLEIPDNNNS